MRIHHLNCGTDCPFGGAIFDGFSKGLLGRIVCQCLLLETDRGLVLIDTGYGLQDVRKPHPRLSRTFHALLNIHFREEETAIRQVQGLGFDPRDVRHIVLTHLDFDHAGGLEDFPNARVHVMEAEKDAAENKRRGFISRRRYRPVQFDEVRDWRTYAGGGEAWFGFDSVRDLDGLPPEILMVPLPGHTWGHAGIAIKTADGWLLNAGDAYFFREEMNVDHPRCTPGLRFYQTLMEVDREKRLGNQDRLRRLKREQGSALTLTCSHDALEYEALSARSPIDTRPRPGAWSSEIMMESVAGQLFGLQMLVTTLVSRVANQQSDPEAFVRELRADALNGVASVDYEVKGDVARVRAAAVQSVNEVLDLLTRGAPRP